MKIGVFVVDDHYMVIEGIRSLLQNEKTIDWMGHATNGESCLSFLKLHEPDVILMDNWIPDTGGVIATQILKSQDDLKEIPVIYFSANNDIQSLAKQAGADTYLEKPFDLNELELVINRMAENRPNLN